MKKNEPVTQIVSRDLLTVSVDQKISDARLLLKENPIHHVPVVEGKRLVGMLSAADILALTFEAYGTDDRAQDAVIDHQFSLRDVMKTEIKTLSEQDSIRSAAELLSDGSFHAIPIVNSDMELLGIVTSTDLINHLLAQY